MLKHELIPAGEADSKSLMVVLHGLGDSMEGYRWLPDAMGLPWLNYLIVNAPDDYSSGFSWYDIYENPAPGVERSRAALFELLDVQRESGFPTDQTFQFGFSQGCLMTMEVAMRYPHRLAGCVGVSGYIHEPEQAIAELSPVAKEQKILFTLGTFDPLIPADKVKGQLNLLRQDGGLQIEAKELPKEHTIAGEEELSLIRDFISAARGDQ
jgi:phospholipase/carboxylesterase